MNYATESHINNIRRENVGPNKSLKPILTYWIQSQSHPQWMACLQGYWYQLSTNFRFAYQIRLTCLLLNNIMHGSAFWRQNKTKKKQKAKQNRTPLYKMLLYIQYLQIKLCIYVQYKISFNLTFPESIISDRKRSL